MSTEISYRPPLLPATPTSPNAPLNTQAGWLWEKVVASTCLAAVSVPSGQAPGVRLGILSGPLHSCCLYQRTPVFKVSIQEAPEEPGYREWLSNIRSVPPERALQQYLSSNKTGGGVWEVPLRSYLPLFFPSCSSRPSSQSSHSYTSWNRKLHKRKRLTQSTLPILLDP